MNYTDEKRIGVSWYLRRGGDYTVNASMTEKRIKAVGVATTVNIGRSYRETDYTMT